MKVDLTSRQVYILSQARWGSSRDWRRSPPSAWKGTFTFKNETYVGQVRTGILKGTQGQYNVDFVVVGSRTRAMYYTLSLHWIVMYHPDVNEPEEVYIVHDPKTRVQKLYKISKNAIGDVNLVLDKGKWYNNIFDFQEVPVNRKIKLRIPRQGITVMRVDDEFTKRKLKRYK